MSEPSRERKLESILHDYLRAVDAGQQPDREELLRQHTELAADLLEFFADQEKMEHFARSLHKAQLGDPTIGADGSSEPETTAARIRYFGDYELLEEIARGGMGVVYKARQVSLNRVVALKMILAGQLASSTEVQRFHDEAEAAANLDHPNIVPIFEIGEHEGNHYFSMKLIEGGNLARQVASVGEFPRKGITILSAVARAVHFAHQRGILHRDLKPANILLDAKDVPMVSDFGLAKRVEGGAVTCSGAIVGTPSYMAPEQARAEKGLSTAVDVYSLGAILFEILTGRPPFRAETPLETLMQVAERDPERPSKIKPGVDRDLETICLKCLEKEPVKRYPSAEAVADDLERWLRGEPIAARPVSQTERAWRWCRRNPAIASMTAAFLVALLAGTIISTWLAFAAIAQADRADENAAKEKEEGDKRARAERAALEALRKEKVASYVNRVALAFVECRDDNLSVGRGLLNKCPAELRGWEWHYVNRLSHPALLTLDGGNGVPGTVAFSPDGRKIVAWGAFLGEPPLSGIPRPAGSKVQGTFVWDADTGKELYVLDTAFLNWAAFSDDGRYLATGSGWVGDGLGDRTVKIWDTATRQVLCTVSSERQLEGMALSPDGKRLYVASQFKSEKGVGEIRAFAIPKCQYLFSIVACGPIAVSTDGKRLAAGSKIWDALTGEKLVDCRGLSANGGLAISDGQVAFSPDGLRLAAAGLGPAPRGILGVWDATTGDRVYEKTYDQPPQCLAFSRDGRLLALGVEGEVRVTMADTGQELFPIRTGVNRLSAVAFHPDGDRLATAAGAKGQRSFDRYAKVWKVASQETLTVPHNIAPGGALSAMTGVSGGLPENPHEPDNLVFHRGGERFALVESGGKAAKVFRLATGVVENAFQPSEERPDDRFLRLAFGQGGNLLALCLTKTRAAKSFGMEVRDLTTGKKLVTLAEQGLEGFGEGVFHVRARFDAEGARLAVAEGKDVKVWDIARAKVICALADAYKAGGIIYFSADGSRVAVARIAVMQGVGTIGMTLYDAGSGAIIRDNLGPFMRLSADGRQVAVQQNNDVVIYDGTTGKELFVLPEAGSLVAFSPDSLRLATTRKVWDAATGKSLCELEEGASHEGVFSPDGRRLATVGNGWEKNQVDIWDTQTGQRTFTLRGFTKQISRIHFTLDGYRIVTVEPSAVKIWNAAPLDVVAGRTGSR